MIDPSKSDWFPCEFSYYFITSLVRNTNKEGFQLDDFFSGTRTTSFRFENIFNFLLLIDKTENILFS